MARVKLEGVSKTYPGGVKALSGVDLIVESGERLVLLGPSGSGKSTLLRIVAGLETPDRGTICIGDEDVTMLPPHQHDVSLAFQHGVLFPHWTVRDELAMGLRKRGWSAFVQNQWPFSLWSKSEAAVIQLAEKAAADLGIVDLLARSPGAMSGGERQRVALGRALVRKPAVFLFDEPLGSVDPHRRFALRNWIAQQTDNGLTATIYVTHDREEALLLGDRVAVMGCGRIEQIGSPREVCESPNSLTVAEVMHGGALNIFRPAHFAGGRKSNAAIPAEAIELTSSHEAVHPEFGWLGFAEIASVKYAYSRQEVRLNNVRVIQGLDFQGLDLQGLDLQGLDLQGLDLQGLQLAATWTASAAPDFNAKPGDRIAWKVDPARVLWFDDVTGKAIPSPIPTN